MAFGSIERSSTIPSRKRSKSRAIFAASAWLDLSERYARGEQIDTKTIRKHANDVLRLSQLLAPDIRIPLAAKIARDLNRFLDGIVLDHSIDPKAIKINNSVVEIVDRIRRAYELHQRR